MIEFNKIKLKLDRAQGIEGIQAQQPKKDYRGLSECVITIDLFIKNLTELFKPLYVLVKNENKFTWTDVAGSPLFENKQKMVGSIRIISTRFRRGICA